MICELMNWLENFNCFTVSCKWLGIKKCEYDLIEVMLIVFFTMLNIVFVAWWLIPLIYIDKCLKGKSINWPVFKCKVK